MGRVKRGRKRELRFLKHWAQHLTVTIIFDFHNTTEGNIIFILEMKKGSSEVVECDASESRACVHDVSQREKF